METFWDFYISCSSFFLLDLPSFNHTSANFEKKWIFWISLQLAKLQESFFFRTLYLGTILNSWRHVVWGGEAVPFQFLFCFNPLNLLLISVPLNPNFVPFFISFKLPLFSYSFISFSYLVIFVNIRILLILLTRLFLLD